MLNKKLRLGLLLGSLDVPWWTYDAIRRIAQAEAGEIVLIVLTEAAETPQGAWRAALYPIFDRVDRKLFARKPDPFAVKNLSELLAGAPILKITPGETLDESDLEIIRNSRLDILLKFGRENLNLSGANLARYGAWFYRHGDERAERKGPPGFWEAAEYWPETTSAVVAAGGIFPRPRVLFRSHFVTYPLSPARHRSYYFWALTPFLARQIDLLHRIGEEEFLKETEQYNVPPARAGEYETPSNLQTLAAVFKLTLRLIRETARRVLYPDRWFLLFSLENETPPNFNKFVKLIPPKGKFWADPHAVRVNGNYYIFIEEFAHARRKGHISVIEMDGQGNYKPPVKILEKDYHLSYPFVFERDGKFYMVPESGANQTIDLYECAEFPRRWVFKRRLMENVSAADATLLRHDGKWWMFAALAENEAAVPNFELFLFYTDDLLAGKWTPHPRNPVVSDVKRARPAGSFFSRDGKLFRPSQDCSRGYGYGFDLNEIEVLSETEYREKRTTSVRPDWDKRLAGTHTFASCGDLTVIDALQRAPIIG
ncbi:MAG: hypothetical protein LC138_05875 [Anaerolineales bacterium]|nr:hypothetical protein [Anaerolineales bacterium]